MIDNYDLETLCSVLYDEPYCFFFKNPDKKYSKRVFTVDFISPVKAGWCTRSDCYIEDWKVLSRTTRAYSLLKHKDSLFTITQELTITLTYDEEDTFKKELINSNKEIDIAVRYMDLSLFDETYDFFLLRDFKHRASRWGSRNCSPNYSKLHGFDRFCLFEYLVEENKFDKERVKATLEVNKKLKNEPANNINHFYNEYPKESFQNYLNFSMKDFEIIHNKALELGNLRFPKHTKLKFFKKSEITEKKVFVKLADMSDLELFSKVQ